MNKVTTIFGTHEQNTIDQIDMCLSHGGERAVLCADGHKGYSQPIGGVIAYKDKISVSGVGFDIGCGNLAIKTDVNCVTTQWSISDIMDIIVNKISFGVGRINNTPIDHELFSDPLWLTSPWKEWKSMAQAQLGTVGSGNHYVDIFVDEQNSVWVGIHFGSRGFGHKTATYFLEKGGGKDGMDVPPCLLDVNSDLGSQYLEGMELAGKYAYAGREYVARKVVTEILRGNILEEIHNHHNFAWKERHFDKDYYVVRKGATPAFPGQRGFVGGSMGDCAVIIEGVDSELSKTALYSTVHGAGRVMGRMEAKGRYKNVDGKKIRQSGKIRHDEMQAWLEQANVCLRGADVDEAPQAYRRLPDVLRAHEGTIKVLHYLRPIGVAMAGKDINDPYKD